MRLLKYRGKLEISVPVDSSPPSPLSTPFGYAQDLRHVERGSRKTFCFLPSPDAGKGLGVRFFHRAFSVISVFVLFYLDSSECKRKKIAEGLNPLPVYIPKFHLALSQYTIATRNVVIITVHC